MSLPDQTAARERPTPPGEGDVTPAQLVALMPERALILLDVREPAEWRVARIAGARLVPLAELRSVVPDLDPSAEIVVYCHHGVRSAYAAALLRGLGFTNVRNLLGGIDRWSLEVEPSMPRY